MALQVAATVLALFVGAYGSSSSKDEAPSQPSAIQLNSSHPLMPDNSHAPSSNPKIQIICSKFDDHHDYELYCPHTKIQSIDFASFGDRHGACRISSHGWCEAKDILSVLEEGCIGKPYCRGQVKNEEMLTLDGEGVFDTANFIFQSTHSNRTSISMKKKVQGNASEIQEKVDRFCMQRPGKRLYVQYSCAPHSATAANFTTHDGVRTIPCCETCMDGCGGLESPECNDALHTPSLGNNFGICDCFGCVDDHKPCARVQAPVVCPQGGRVPYFALKSPSNPSDPTMISEPEGAVNSAALCQQKNTLEACSKLSHICEWKEDKCGAIASHAEPSRDVPAAPAVPVGTANSPHLRDPCAQHSLSKKACTAAAEVLVLNCKWIEQKGGPGTCGYVLGDIVDSGGSTIGFHPQAGDDAGSYNHPAPQYIGCFQALHKDRSEAVEYDFEEYRGVKKMNSPETCRQACGPSMPYLALSAGVHCACSVEPPHFLELPAAECDTKCPGEKTEKCGAAQKNSVYRAGPPEPAFPSDFKLVAPQVATGPDWRCIPVNDPLNRELVGFNWCQTRSTRWLGWEFSPDGVLAGMDCVHFHTDVKNNFKLIQLEHESEQAQALQLEQWEGEWLCVRKDEPLFLELDWFADSSADRLPFDASENCVNWGRDVGKEGEPSNHTQFLCHVPAEPRWPVDFQWSGTGKVSDFNCISVREINGGLMDEGDTVNNFWCQRKGTRWLGWTFGPHISNMQCTKLSDTAADYRHTGVFRFFDILASAGLFLCLYPDSAIGDDLVWYESTLPKAFEKSECVQWSEVNGADSTDNYLCGTPSLRESNALKSMQMDCRADTERRCSCIDQDAHKKFGHKAASQSTLERYYNSYFQSKKQLEGTQKCIEYPNYVTVWESKCKCSSSDDDNDDSGPISYEFALAGFIVLAACCCCNAMLALALFATVFAKRAQRPDGDAEEQENMIEKPGKRKKRIVDPKKKQSAKDYIQDLAIDAAKEIKEVKRSIELVVTTGNATGTK